MYLQINGYIPTPPPVVNPWGNTPQPDAATPAAPSQETRPTPPTQTETQQYNGPLYTRGTGKSARAQVIGAGTGCNGAVYFHFSSQGNSKQTPVNSQLSQTLTNMLKNKEFHNFISNRT